MVASGSALPVKVGVVSSVVVPSLIGAVTVPASSPMAVSTGAAGTPVSTLKLTVPEAGPVLPAASVAVSEMACGPSPSGVAGVKLQVPAASAIAVPRMAAPSRMVMVASGSALPVKVGVVSSVVVPSLIGAVTVPASSPMAVSTGAAGTPVSTLKLTVPEAGPVLPAASVAVSEMACGPSPSGVAGVKLQVPAASAIAVPRMAAPSRMVMVASGSALPVKVGVVSSVVVPSLIGAVTVPASSPMAVSTGAAGAPVSTLKVTVPEAGPVLPAASVAVSEMACGPSPSGVAGVKLQVPAASAIAVPRMAAPSRMVMVASGSALPVKVGVVSSVVVPSLIGAVTVPASSPMAVSTGAAGAPVSTLKLTVPEAGPVLPAASVAVSEMACGPSPSGVAGVKLQVPAASAIAVPRMAAPSRMVMVASGSALPVKVGVVSSVVVPSLIGAVTVPASSPMAVSTGAAGTPVSTLKVTVPEAGPVLPAASVAVSEMACGPSPSGVAGVKLQVPAASAIAVPRMAAPSRMVMVASGSALPVKVGVVSSVVVPSLIGAVTVPASSPMAVSTGAAGDSSS